MANTIGRIKCLVRIIPQEQIISTTVSSVWENDYTEKNTLAPRMSTLYNSEPVTFSDTGKTSFGYLNGVPFLANITTTSTAAISTGVAQVEFIYFEHTGKRFNTFTDATCDTDHTAGSGSTFGGNPKIIQMDDTALIIEGMDVSGTGIAADSVVTQIDSDTLFRVDIDTTATNSNQTLTFTGNNSLSVEGDNGTTNEDDYLEIRGGADDGFVIAVLAPGESIALPVRSEADWTVTADEVATSDYFFQSVDPGDLTAGANTIAMRYLAATAS